MTTLTLAKLAKIEAAAAKATPGPWTTTDCSNGGALLMRGGPKFIQTHLQIVPIEDAAYIALCDPATVAALVRIAKAAIAVVDQDDRGAYVRRNDAASNAMNALRDAGLLE